MNRFRLDGKTAVVLGAGSVLARSWVGGLVEAGAKVILCGRNLSRLDGTLGPTYAVDANDAVSLGTLARTVEAEHGPLSILVNAVGGNQKAACTTAERSFFDLDPAALSEVVQLNLMAGAVLPAQAFGPALTRNPAGGTIINITSMAAERPLTRVPGYSAAKAAVSNFTRWLALELARDFGERIRVNAIAPGFFLTDQNRDLLTDPSTGQPTERARAILANTPMGRFGAPDDLVGALIWLASDSSRFVTGVVVPVDGGFSAFAGV